MTTIWCSRKSSDGRNGAAFQEVRPSVFKNLGLSADSFNDLLADKQERITQQYKTSVTKILN